MNSVGGKFAVVNMQFLRGSPRYVANVVDGKVTRYGTR